jgi:hypothetical protein
MTEPPVRDQWTKWLVERNESKGMSAVAYLWAVKQEA